MSAISSISNFGKKPIIIEPGKDRDYDPGYKFPEPPMFPPKPPVGKKPSLIRIGDKNLFLNPPVRDKELHIPPYTLDKAQFNLLG
ncbi:MAG: hypothetical protein PHC34_08900 [Candidatus Gastranaerophilales bacterium]|nr:hypothetical protein [Candidatus Gastranaerophilales bacterium]